MQHRRKENKILPRNQRYFDIRPAGHMLVQIFRRVQSGESATGDYDLGFLHEAIFAGPSRVVKDSVSFLSIGTRHGESSRHHRPASETGSLVCFADCSSRRRMRMISRCPSGVAKALWPLRTTNSDAAPARCELVYGTTPSLLVSMGPELCCPTMLWKGTAIGRGASALSTGSFGERVCTAEKFNSL